MRDKLVDEFLKGNTAIVPIFDRSIRRLDEQIAAYEGQIADAKMEQATFDQLLEFSKSMLVNIHTAWEHANLNQKQKVQNLLFPGGLIHEPEKGILNPHNDSLFMHLENFLGRKMHLVRPERFELPT